jgi:alkyl sulfatase BDS1-like metallo-beta-lactamase superfamily hydrolase
MSPHRYNFNISIETENMFFQTHEALLIIKMNLPQWGNNDIYTLQAKIKKKNEYAKTIHDNTLIRVIYHT